MLQIIKDLGNLLGPVGRQFLKSGFDAGDVQQLHDRRIQIRAGKADLPKRRAELAGAEATLNRLAAELEWSGDIDQLIARIPARAKIATLRTLLNRRGEQIAAVENAKAAVDEADDKLAELSSLIETLGPVTDVSKLTAVTKATRAMGHIAGQIANSKRDEEDARAAIDRGLKSLRPPVGDHEALTAMSVPPLDSVEAHRDAYRDLEQRSKDGSCRHWPRQLTEKSPATCRAFPRNGFRRPRPRSVEVVVHADAGDVFPGMPSVSDLELCRYRKSKISDRRVTAEVKVKVFELGRPIVREHPFGASARGPADLGLADTGSRLFGLEVSCRSVNMAIGQTARPIEQQIGGNGDAETATHRAEPCKLWLGRKREFRWYSADRCPTRLVPR